MPDDQDVSDAWSVVPRLALGIPLMFERTFSRRDERLIPVPPGRAFECALRFEEYALWWDARFKVEATSTGSASRIGARVEFSPAPLNRTGWEVVAVVEDQAIELIYHKGWHAGTGAWRFASAPGGTIVSFEMTIEPNNLFFAALYTLGRVEDRHSKDLQGLMARMEKHLLAHSAG